MKKSILTIALIMVFGLLCNTSLWAGNGKGAGDGSMLTVDLSNPTIFAGDVVNAGIAGSGLSIDDGTEITTIYGMGPSGYWNSLGVLKPVFGDEVSVAAVLVTFSDEDRWIAVSRPDSSAKLIKLRRNQATKFTADNLLQITSRPQQHFFIAYILEIT